MPARTNKFMLLNWIFIPGLMVLVLNDHYFKWQYGNWLTGKLSDFAGLLIFPMFLAFLLPPLSKYVSMISGLGFILWKLPFSESFIEFYNKIAPISVSRIVDYTDLVALSILPLSHCIIQRIENFKIRCICTPSVHSIIFILPCSFIFMATSPPIRYYKKPGGDIHIGKTFKLKMTKEEFIKKLKEEGLTVKQDTSQQVPLAKSSYLIENVVLAGGKDTLKSIHFALIGGGKRTLLLLNNVSFNGDRKISDWKELKRYSRYYRKLIDSEIIEEVR